MADQQLHLRQPPSRPSHDLYGRGLSLPHSHSLDPPTSERVSCKITPLNARQSFLQQPTLQTYQDMSQAAAANWHPAENRLSFSNSTPPPRLHCPEPQSHPSESSVHELSADACQVSSSCVYSEPVTNTQGNPSQCYSIPRNDNANLWPGGQPSKWMWPDQCSESPIKHFNANEAGHDESQLSDSIDDEQLRQQFRQDQLSQLASLRRQQKKKLLQDEIPPDCLQVGAMDTKSRINVHCNYQGHGDNLASTTSELPSMATHGFNISHDSMSHQQVVRSKSVMSETNQPSMPNVFHQHCIEQDMHDARLNHTAFSAEAYPHPEQQQSHRSQTSNRSIQGQTPTKPTQLSQFPDDETTASTATGVAYRSNFGTPSSCAGSHCGQEQTPSRKSFRTPQLSGHSETLSQLQLIEQQQLILEQQKQLLLQKQFSFGDSTHHALTTSHASQDFVGKVQLQQHCSPLPSARTSREGTPASRSRSRRTVDSYEAIGVDLDAKAEEVKKMYQTKIKSCHPDKGGTHDDFLQTQDAMSYICEKRQSVARLAGRNLGTTCSTSRNSVCSTTASHGRSATTPSGNVDQGTRQPNGPNETSSCQQEEHFSFKPDCRQLAQSHCSSSVEDRHAEIAVPRLSHLSTRNSNMYVISNVHRGIQQDGEHKTMYDSCSEAWDPYEGHCSTVSHLPTLLGTSERHDDLKQSYEARCSFSRATETQPEQGNPAKVEPCPPSLCQQTRPTQVPKLALPVRAGDCPVKSSPHPGTSCHLAETHNNKHDFFQENQPQLQEFNIPSGGLGNSMGKTRSLSSSIRTATGQMQGLSGQRRTVVDSLRQRLYGMELQCGQLSEDYEMLAEVDKELGDVVRALRGAFAVERAALACGDGDGVRT